MEIKKLETMEQVEAAVREALAMPIWPKKAERERARRLGDLFDLQAQLYREAGETAAAEVDPVYRSACFIAASTMTNRANQFHKTAGGR